VTSTIRPFAITVFIVVLWTSTGAADDADFGVRGLGTQSCGNFLADATRAEDGRLPADVYPHLAALAWVQGFVSYPGLLALNTTQPTDYRIKDVDPESMNMWLGSYCRQHPLEKIVDAAIGLIADLEQPKTH
jgi:hypothetical protein